MKIDKSDSKLTYFKYNLHVCDSFSRVVLWRVRRWKYMWQFWDGWYNDRFIIYSDIGDSLWASCQDYWLVISQSVFKLLEFGSLWALIDVAWMNNICILKLCDSKWFGVQIHFILLNISLFYLCKTLTLNELNIGIMVSPFNDILLELWYIIRKYIFTHREWSNSCNSN